MPTRSHAFTDRVTFTLPSVIASAMSGGIPTDTACCAAARSFFGNSRGMRRASIDSASPFSSARTTSSWIRLSSSVAMFFLNRRMRSSHALSVRSSYFIRRSHHRGFRASSKRSKSVRVTVASRSSSSANASRCCFSRSTSGSLSSDIGHLSVVLRSSFRFVSVNHARILWLESDRVLIEEARERVNGERRSGPAPWLGEHDLCATDDLLGCVAREQVLHDLSFARCPSRRRTIVRVHEHLVERFNDGLVRARSRRLGNRNLDGRRTRTQLSIPTLLLSLARLASVCVFVSSSLRVRGDRLVDLVIVETRSTREAAGRV